jgi:hypothetical protein
MTKCLCANTGLLYVENLMKNHTLYAVKPKCVYAIPVGLRIVKNAKSGLKDEYRG